MNNKLREVEASTDSTNWHLFTKMKKEIVEFYVKKEYEKGLQKSLQLIEKFHQFPEVTYFYTACFYALLNQKELALNYLTPEMEKGACILIQIWDILLPMISLRDCRSI